MRDEFAPRGPREPLGGDDDKRATDEERSGYARRRAVINEMRRAACFRLAELSRPVPGRPTLRLPESARRSPVLSGTASVLPAPASEEGADGNPGSASVLPAFMPGSSDELSRDAEAISPEALVHETPHDEAPATKAAATVTGEPSWLGSCAEFGDEATTLGLLLIDFAEANIRRHLDLARALLTAKSLEDAIERHDTYMKSSLRIFEQQAAELEALSSREKQPV